MSIYPIKVKKESGRAESPSGGKDYHLVLISCADGRSLLIKRFGKKGSWGVGFDVKRYEEGSSAWAAYQAKRREKLGREYSEQIIDTDVTCGSWEEFRAALGETYWNKIGAGNLEWIMPGADTTGVREDSSIEFEKDANGKTRVKERPKRLVAEPIETPVDRAKETPVWGLF